MIAADIPAGLGLCRASHWNQLEDDWRMFIEPPSRAWTLERDGVAIGTAALARYDKLAWVAMMLVDPAERRAGHGARLLSAALAAAEGSPCVGLDATPLGQPLYRKYGFVESYSLMRMSWGGPPGPPSPRSGPGGPFHVITSSQLPAILAMDRDIFGADRSHLLASLLQRAPESAWTIDGRGYCFGRPGRLYHQIGPIVATDPDTARALVAHALSDRPAVIDVPLLDSASLTTLNSLGFVEERRFTRMFLRGHLHPGDPARQYAIAGPEFA
jgi:GNAT superfamily N-acetyltransferase